MAAPERTLSLGVVGQMMARWRYGFLLESLIVRDIRVKYRRSALGIVWTLINPLLMMLIFTVVFSTLFRTALPHFAIYFLAAYLPWQFFAQTSSLAMGSMLRNSSLYKRIYVPKYVFVLAVVGADLLGFLIALVPLAAIMVGLGHTMTPALLFLPVSLVFLTLFTTGVALLFSTVAVFFDDLAQFYNVLLQALMYLSAIFYPVDIIPPPLRVFVYLNPMYYCIQMVRYPIYYGALPPPLIVAGCVVMTAAALFAGVKVFAWASHKFVYYA